MRVLCWLGIHNWRCYLIEDTGRALVGRRHCLRCEARASTIISDTPADHPDYDATWAP